MSDINKGVLIYNEWFESMRALKPRDFKTIMLAIYDLQIHNAPPPEFDGVAGAIASIIFPYIERRKLQSERGRAGAAARYSTEHGEPDDDSPANSAANSTANGTANGTAISQNKNKLNKTKSIYNQIKPNPSAYPSAAGGQGRAGGFAAQKRATDEPQSFNTDEFFAAAVRHSLGDI